MPYAQGFYALCGFCDYNADCPKFPQGLDQPQWNDALLKLDALKCRRSVLDNEIKEIEAALKQAHQGSGSQDWITTGQCRFRTSVSSGRKMLDRIPLQKEQDSICGQAHIDPIDVDALLRRHEQEGAPGCRLSITALN